MLGKSDYSEVLMPDISGFAALDVAIGLIFVYLVFSLIASGVNEAIASIFALRARHLEKGLRKLLTNPGSTPAQVSEAVDEFARHPLVRGLVNKPPSSKLPWRRPL